MVAEEEEEEQDVGADAFLAWKEATQVEPKDADALKAAEDKPKRVGSFKIRIRVAPRATNQVQ
jgi:hypothetical protein